MARIDAEKATCPCGKRLTYNDMQKHMRTCPQIEAGTQVFVPEKGCYLRACNHVETHAASGETRRCVYLASTAGTQRHDKLGHGVTEVLVTEVPGTEVQTPPDDSSAPTPAQETSPHAVPTSPNDGSAPTPAQEPSAHVVPSDSPGPTQGIESHANFVTVGIPTNDHRIRTFMARTPGKPPAIKDAATRRQFRSLCDRVANDFIHEPSRTTWVRLLMAPLTLRGEVKQWKANIARYPLLDVEAPAPDAPPPRTAVDRTERLTRRQRYGTAARTLLDRSNIHPPTTEVRTVVQGLFPCTDHHVERHPNVPPHAGVEPNLWYGDLELYAQQVKPDAGVGPYGWTPTLVQGAMKRHSASEATPFTRAIALYGSLWEGGNAPAVLDTMLAAVLPLDKTKGADPTALQVRPICIGSIVERIIARAWLKRTEVGTFLLPIQLGVKSRGGVEPIIHHLHTRVRDATQDPAMADDRSIHLLDFKNAFNTIHPNAILEGVRKYAPPLYNLAWSLLSEPRYVVVGEGIITTNHGVPQGCVWSPLLFSIGIRRTLELFTERVNTLDLASWTLAYMDDITLESKLNKEETIALWNDCDAATEAPTRLALNVEKTRAVRLADVVTSGVDVLGSHIGSISSTATFIKHQLEEHKAKIRRLDATTTRDTAVRLFDVCVNRELVFLQRTMDPWKVTLPTFEELWEDIDQYRRAWLLRQAGLLEPEVSEAGTLNMYLPRRLGGAGVYDYQRTANAACSASWHEAVQVLVKRKVLPPAALNQPVPPCAPPSPDEVSDWGVIPSQKNQSSNIYKYMSQQVTALCTPAQQRLHGANTSPIMGAAWQHWGADVAHHSAREWSLLLRSRWLEPDVIEEVCPNCHRAHRRVGHSRGCTQFLHTSRHDTLLARVGRQLKEDYAVTLEPVVSPNDTSVRADIRLSPKRANAGNVNITADLMIVETESPKAHNIYDAVTEDLITAEVSACPVGAATTRALLRVAYQRKEARYRRAHIAGVTPWVVTTYGTAHDVFAKWIKQLRGPLRNAVYSQLSSSLLRARAIATAHTNF